MRAHFLQNFFLFLLVHNSEFFRKRNQELLYQNAFWCGLVLNGLTLFNDVQLRTRRALLLYILYMVVAPFWFSTEHLALKLQYVKWCKFVNVNQFFSPSNLTYCTHVAKTTLIDITTSNPPGWLNPIGYHIKLADVGQMKEALPLYSVS